MQNVNTGAPVELECCSCSILPVLCLMAIITIIKILHFTKSLTSEADIGFSLGTQILGVLFSAAHFHISVRLSFFEVCYFTTLSTAKIIVSVTDK